MPVKPWSTVNTSDPPLSPQRYNAMVRAQGIGEVLLDESAVQAAFEGLVISQATLDRVGPAVNSGQSVFLYGPPGNGKTTMAARMARLLGRDPIYVPYAVSIDRHIIKVYDDFNQTRVDAPPPSERPRLGLDVPVLDRRRLQIQRPAVVAGGELTLESLDLIWDPTAKYYEAPFQMKANGGMFLIDDFGRQQMDPQDLLNRWIVPLERRIDFLSLHTGKKIDIPFEQVVVFSSNLDPTGLVDEVSLRRIRHKIKAGKPNTHQQHIREMAQLQRHLLRPGISDMIHEQRGHEHQSKDGSGSVVERLLANAQPLVNRLISDLS